MRALVVLDRRKERSRAGRQLERLDVVVLVDGHDHRVGLADDLGNALPGLLEAAPQTLCLERIDLVGVELTRDVLPAQQGADGGAGRFQTVARLDRQDYRVAVDARPVGAGGLVQHPLRCIARLPGLRRGVRPQNHVAEAAVVTHVPGRGGQQVDGGAGRLGAIGERAGASDLIAQPLVDHLLTHPLLAGLVVHLTQVGAVAEAPRPGQRGRRIGRIQIRVLVVEEPRDLTPTAQPFLQLDAV